MSVCLSVYHLSSNYFSIFLEYKFMRSGITIFSVSRTMPGLHETLSVFMLLLLTGWITVLNVPLCDLMSLRLSETLKIVLLHLLLI